MEKRTNDISFQAHVPKFLQQFSGMLKKTGMSSSKVMQAKAKYDDRESDDEPDELEIAALREYAHREHRDYDALYKDLYGKSPKQQSTEKAEKSEDKAGEAEDEAAVAPADSKKRPADSQQTPKPSLEPVTDNSIKAAIARRQEQEKNQRNAAPVAQTATSKTERAKKRRKQASKLSFHDEDEEA